MRVSVLIPTRDRLDYLRLAVESVRRQSRADWEIVIADNASSEDVAGYVDALAEPRVVFRRSSIPLSVTDNWNAALDAASGERVIMLGDDDALLPGYLEAVGEQPGDVELIYSGAWLFAYPGVFPEQPDGYAEPYGYAEFLRGTDGPRDVPHALAVELVRDAMRFRLRFGFNMQFATLGRGLIEALRAHGPVFQSPFPDYYAMCAALLQARRIVADPRPLVAIGVTPKSYGYYHANRREDEGMAFLDPSLRDAVPPHLQREVLPGTKVNTGWLLAMDTLQRRLGAEHGLVLDVGRYRFVQAMTTHRDRYLAGTASAEEVRELRRHLRPRERAAFAAVAAGMRIAHAVPPGVAARVLEPVRRRLGQFPAWAPPRVEGRYRDVLELFDALRDGPPPAPAASGASSGSKGG